MFELWRKRINCKNFGLSYEDPTVFIQSQWQKEPEPNCYYMVYRLIITTYLVITWVLTIIDEPNLGQSFIFYLKWLIYLTNWGFTCCTFQAVLCTAMLFYRYAYLKKQSEGIAKDETQVDTTGLRFYKVYWFFFTVSLDLAVTITILYWLVIFQPGTTPIDYLNVMVHVTNSLVMLLELIIVAHPIRLCHFYIGTTPGFAFTLFSLVYQLAGGTSRENKPTIYAIIDWRKPFKTIAVCLGALVLIIVIHCLTYAVYRLRLFVAKKLNRISTSSSPTMTFNGFDNNCLANNNL